MLGSIDLRKSPIKPQIFLAKPDRTIIAKMIEAYDINFNQRLGSLNELSFTLPYEVEKYHKLVRNPSIDLIHHRYLLKFVLGNYEEWFIIDAPKDVMASEGDSKEVHAFSLGYELTDKMIREYKQTSKNASQVLVDALRYTIWNIGYIDSAFDVKFRSFEVSSKTVLDFVYEIAETFNAVIIWDTIKRQIHLYNQELVGSNRGLRFSYGRYLKTLGKEIQPDEMTTRLKLFGKNNLSIQTVNPTGTNYIENFGYFMFPFYRDENRNVVSHSDYMSDELCHAILDYTQLIDDNKQLFGTYLQNLEGIQKSLGTAEQRLTTLKLELQKIEDNIFVDQNSENPTGAYEPQKVTKEQEIASQEAVIQSLNQDLANAQLQIDDLKEKLSIEANFSPELISERNQFIIEKEWSNEQIIDAKDLYEAGLKVFVEFSKPKTVITMDVVNFLEVVEEQRNWDKISIGDTIFIHYEKLRVEVTAKIIGIEYNYENATIKLTIANTTEIESNKDKFIRSLYKSISTSTKVDMSKFKWDKYENDLGDIDKVLQEFWDKAKEQISMAVNETVIIDRTGITIRDDKDPLRFLRMTHGAIGLTRSGGNRYETAITPDGIIAERLFGRIITGERVVIGDPDGILEIRGNKGVVTDRNGREVMWFGLYATNPDKFGLKLENDRNQVIVDRDDGFTITKKNGSNWDKIIWTDTATGTLYTDGLVTKHLKILSNKNEIILDAEAGIIDLRPLKGNLGQSIELNVEDGITITRVPNKENKIWLNAEKGIAIDRNDGSANSPKWTSVFYVDTKGNIVCNDVTANHLIAKELTIENDNSLVSLKPEEGLLIKRKDERVQIGLNVTDGIYIDANSDEFGHERVFGVDTKGVLFAKHMRTHSLEIFSDQTGNKLLLDADQSILRLDNFHMIVGQLDADNINVGNIFADFGLINNLSVNRLVTLNPNQSGQVDYIDAHGKVIQFITATAVDSGSQAMDSKGNPLFYTDMTRTRRTTEDTGIPVTIMSYENPLVKSEFTFEGTGDSSYPVWTIGSGSGQGDNEKAKIYKQGQELIIQYNTSAQAGAGGKKILKLSDQEISFTSDVGGTIATFKMQNNGDLEYTHPGGSKYVFGKDFTATVAGNMSLIATGNTKIGGARIDLN